MDTFLEQAFRRGAIPYLCGGSTVCFGIYAWKVWQGARAYEAMENLQIKVHSGQLDVGQHAILPDVEVDLGSLHSQQLLEHAASCVALTTTSLAIAIEATRDWRHYRKMDTLEQMEAWIFLQRRPLFFLRPSVLCIAAASFWVAHDQTGQIRLWYSPDS